MAVAFGLFGIVVWVLLFRRIRSAPTRASGLANTAALVVFLWAWASVLVAWP